MPLNDNLTNQEQLNFTDTQIDKLAALTDPSNQADPAIMAELAKSSRFTFQLEPGTPVEILATDFLYRAGVIAFEERKAKVTQLRNQAQEYSQLSPLDKQALSSRLGQTALDAYFDKLRQITQRLNPENINKINDLRSFMAHIIIRHVVAAEDSDFSLPEAV